MNLVQSSTSSRNDEIIINIWLFMPTSLAATLNMKMAVKKWFELINSSMIDFVSAAGYLIAIIFDSGWFFFGYSRWVSQSQNAKMFPASQKMELNIRQASGKQSRRSPLTRNQQTNAPSFRLINSIKFKSNGYKLIRRRDKRRGLFQAMQVDLLICIPEVHSGRDAGDVVSVVSISKWTPPTPRYKRL